MPTILQSIEQISAQFEAADLFYGHGTDNAWDEACYLVLQQMQLPPDAGHEVAEQAVPDTVWKQIQSLTDQRITQKLPLPYLLGEAYFAGLPFYVSPDVLIPRSPIAELIDQSFFPWLTNPNPHICEIGTGSGCIAIAIAHYLPTANVIATDICPNALAMAAKNIQRHQLSERVQLIQSDLFDSIPAQQFDLIVSNPPYVDAQEMHDLPAEYRHEPELALASGHDGLDHVRRMFAQAVNYLTDEGVLIVEVGASQPALEAAFSQTAFLWLEFEYGGDGVFLLTKQQLQAMQSQ